MQQKLNKILLDEDKIEIDDTNKEKIFAIHGGGNIGLGLMADIVSKSTTPYRIIATSNNRFFRNIINCKNQLWISHDSYYTETTFIENISMVPREKKDIIRLYTCADLAAICLTPAAFLFSVNSIAHGLIERKKSDRPGLKILILINYPNCAKFVEKHITEELLKITKNLSKTSKIISYIQFIPTVIDRIVYKFSNLKVKEQLENNLKVCLFNAEREFSFYVPSSFKEASYFPNIETIQDIEQIEALKNKYINGPHTVLAWIGSLMGYRTISEAICNSDIYSFLKEMMEFEILPILKAEYPDIPLSKFEHIKNKFFERCKENKEDTTTRVGRDPLRKLNTKGRIRGTIELCKKHNLNMAISRLEIGIAAGLLYAITGKDNSNAGCVKIKQIYEENNNSYQSVLCYQGEFNGGIYRGLNSKNDENLIENIIYWINNLDNTIKSNIPFSGINNVLNIRKCLDDIGIQLDIKSGHIFYKKNYKPLSINFDLVFVRHGETYGNCGQSTQAGKIDYQLVEAGVKDHQKRIFQGNVDSEINQLTKFGKEQAKKVSIELEQEFITKGWIPDIIFYSPLSRAKETGLPFVEKNSFEDRYICLPGITEMTFGAWDNRRVRDIDPKDSCHLFYLNQNTVVKNAGINGDGKEHPAENFCEVLIRAYTVLQKIEKECAGKKIIMFSHSMFGAACCILLGLGKKIENGEYLAFDGKRKDGSYYTLPNAKPLLLSKCTLK